jgi:hypothetical protein
MEHNDKKKHRTETNDFVTVQCLGYDVTYNPDILKRGLGSTREVVQIIGGGKSYTYLKLWSFNPPEIPSILSSRDLKFDIDLLLQILNLPPQYETDFDNYEYVKICGNPYVKVSTEIL